MGTVIQDQQQHNPEGQPRWDRFERADLFAQYRELRTQGFSERQAAKELKVPRTTLQAWRVWHDTLDICPHVAEFFQSGPGLAFLHRLVIAFHMVCVEVGAGGIRFRKRLSRRKREIFYGKTARTLSRAKGFSFTDANNGLIRV